MSKISVIFVCMGNICRSPTAEGVFRSHVLSAGLSDLITIDSAGTHAYHIGEKPDRRARETALRRGIDLDSIRARKVYRGDIEVFDYVLAMDKDNLSDLRAMAPVELADKIRLFMEYADGFEEQEVPDPYYGGLSGFDRVLDMIEAASAGLLTEICRQQGWAPIK